MKVSTSVLTLLVVVAFCALPYEGVGEASQVLVAQAEPGAAPGEPGMEESAEVPAMQEKAEDEGDAKEKKANKDKKAKKEKSAKEVKKEKKAQKEKIEKKVKKAKKTKHGKKGKHESGEDEDAGRMRGLDRADEAAGEHGLQGRDKARSKQGR